MYEYVCMYVCMCVCVCMYVYMHVCILFEYINSKQTIFPAPTISPYTLSFILSLRHKHNLTVILEGQRGLGDQPK